MNKGMNFIPETQGIEEEYLQISEPNSDVSEQEQRNTKLEFSPDERFAIGYYEKSPPPGLIDLSKDIPRPSLAFSIEIQGKRVPFGSQGNFSLIIGRPKSKKSFLSILLMANAIKTLSPERNRIILFDTEQDRWKVQQNGRLVLQLASITDETRLQVYSLREFDSEKRTKIIKDVILYPRNKNVGLIVLDGIRDLVTSINDEEQATKIANLFLQWTAKNNFHLITILHQNKSDYNARGHLGAELVNKAENVIVLTQGDNKKSSKVEFEFTRGIPLDSFTIEIDEEGKPFISEIVGGNTLGLPATDNPRRKKISPEKVSSELTFAMIRSVFEKDEKLPYGQLIEKIREVLKSNQFPSGENKAKEFSTYWNKLSLIQQENSLYSIRLIGASPTG